MRLFSKVREGTAFDVGSQNTNIQSVQPVLRQQLDSDNAEEQQASTESLSAFVDVFCLHHSSTMCNAPLLYVLFCCETRPDMAGHLLLCRDLPAVLRPSKFVWMQIQQQAAQVAIDAAQILAQAESLKQAAAPDTAEVWTDGSLGKDEGLPPRKTRIYISSSAAVKGTSSSAPFTASSTDGEQPSKKKRKGKAERNRLKREAALAPKVT